MTNYQPLAEVFKSTLRKLNLGADSSLHREVSNICNYLANPNLRIAVFGPFNHGKSTLLNAILGEKTLPIDLIPTTGAAIIVKYGTDTRTQITLRNGEIIYRSGTDILKEFAILDGDRRMRDDVISVEVYVPNSLLATGVEFLDLPGTNDRQAQDHLVQEQLLGADLVIQLLDARKLMTLGERENLRDWLIDKGIKSVIFVANFLNLLEVEEQKSVYNRLLFVAESFRAELPDGYSNIYRVDALPALRSRLKGDTQAAISSGLITFESALQNIVASIQQNRPSVSTPRVEQVAIQLQRELINKITPLQTELSKCDRKNETVNQIKTQAESLIQQGFTTSIKKLRDYLSVTNLRDKYQAGAAIALAQNQFSQWEESTLKSDLNALQQEISKWIYQAHDFFHSGQPEKLFIPIPNLPDPNFANTETESKSHNFSEPGSFAVGGGIGWVLGGPIGAAVVGSVTYLLNKKIHEKETDHPEETRHRQLAKKCIEATDIYFLNLSNQGLQILTDYEHQAWQTIKYVPEAEISEITQQRLELYRWSLILFHLNQQLESILRINIQPEFKIPIPVEPKINKATSTHDVKPKIPTSTYRYQRTNMKEELGTKSQQKQQSQTKFEHPQNNQQTHQSSTSRAQQTPQTPKVKQPTAEEIETKFGAWEIEQELAQMKVNMGKKAQSKSTQETQSKQTHPKSSKASDLHKINRAYTILGIKPGASIEEIKIAYRQLVKKWHPDLFVSKPQELKRAQNNMHHINEAYTVLLDNI